MPTVTALLTTHWSMIGCVLPWSISFGEIVKAMTFAGGGGCQSMVFVSVVQPTKHRPSFMVSPAGQVPSRRTSWTQFPPSSSDAPEQEPSGFFGTSAAVVALTVTVLCWPAAFLLASAAMLRWPIQSFSCSPDDVMAPEPTAAPCASTIPVAWRPFANGMCASTRSEYGSPAVPALSLKSSGNLHCPTSRRMSLICPLSSLSAWKLPFFTVWLN